MRDAVRHGAATRAILVTACLVPLMAVAACGRKGPPLPPLVKLPVAPADLVAERRGDTVDLQFTVPSTNTDKSKPANVSRVDVYGFTGATTVSDADVMKHGVKVASVAVKAPRDPNATTDPDDPEETAEDVDAPEGEGLDQGVVARVTDTLDAAARVTMTVPLSRKAQKAMSAMVEDAGDRPLLGPPPENGAVRTYIGVGVATNGRKGPSSRRVVVPLLPPPAAPGAPDVTFTETAVTVSWRPSPSAAVVQEPATGDILPARLIGISSPHVAYHVYEQTAPARGNGMQLTRAPVSDTHFTDNRMTWGTTRCYSVRAIQVVDALSIESEASAPACATLVDTFPPGAPTGLNAVATAGEIDLIWDPNQEADLQGYIVLRGLDPAGKLSPITPMAIHETSFHDTVPGGTRYAYAVQAVDKAGNVSPMSQRIEETAR